MDPLMLVLRLFHIVFATFWVGSDVFTTFFLIPRLRALGPDVERPVTGALIKILPPALMVSSIITLATGIVMAGIMWGWTLSGVLASGWATAMLVGFILTIVAMVVGFGLIPPVTMRMERINRNIKGRAPTPEEARQLAQLTSRVTTLARSNSVLLVIVVAAMAIARFV
jgi:hypothetical protein